MHTMNVPIVLRYVRSILLVSCIFSFSHIHSHITHLSSIQPRTLGNLAAIFYKKFYFTTQQQSKSWQSTTSNYTTTFLMMMIFFHTHKKKEDSDQQTFSNN